MMRRHEYDSPWSYQEGAGRSGGQGQGLAIERLHCWSFIDLVDFHKGRKDPKLLKSDCQTSSEWLT